MDISDEHAICGVVKRRGRGWGHCY